MFTWLVLFDGHVLVPSYCYLYHFHFLPFKGCTAFSEYPMSSFSLHSLAKDIRTRKRSFQTLEVRIPMCPMIFFLLLFFICSHWLHDFSQYWNYFTSIVCMNAVFWNWTKNCICHDQSVEVYLRLLCNRLLFEINYNSQRNACCDDNC